MRLSVTTAALPLTETFAIARSARESTALVRAEIEHEGIVGRSYA